jgi:C-terminal peptidase prc
MLRHAPLLALVLTVLAAAENPASGQTRSTEVVQGDLHQIGDAGEFPASFEAMFEQELTDTQARAAFEQSLELLLHEYRGSEVSEAELYLGALAGMIEALNWSETQGGAQESTRGGASAGRTARNALLTERETSHADRMQNGLKTGIGLEFQASSADGVLYINRVVRDSPADRGGVRVGDRVVAIDGTRLLGKSLDGVLGLLQGDEGTPIGLTLVRGTNPALRIDVVLTRATYSLPSVEVRPIDDETAYVRISQFHGRTAEELRTELTELSGAGVNAIILDLRSNQGGLLDAVHDVASQLLPAGAVVALVEDAQGRDRQLLAEGPPLHTGPLVCLVNRWTASGAEVLAATLQENDRAVLIGESTAGKGTTESLYSLTPTLSLKMTSTAMYSPLGQSWGDTGLTPDYLVQGGPLGTSLGGAAAWPRTDVLISFAAELVHTSVER